MREPGGTLIGFNPYVHGARGLFAVQILIFHLLGADWPVYPAAWTGGGRILKRVCEYGVELFFCVSGYVMVQALSRAAGPCAFIRDRAIRIVPLLWVVVPASLLFGMLTGRRPVWLLPFSDIVLVGLANMLALPGLFAIWMFNPATWSLSYEMAFYVLCGAWLAAGGLPAGWRGLRAGRGAVLVAGGVMLLFYPRGLPFMLGVLVGLDDGGAVGGLARWPGLLIGAFLLVWALIQALSADGVLLIDTTLLQWGGDWRLALAGVGLCCLLFGFRGLVAGEGHLGRFLTWRVMQFLGTISFSFYLWQNAALGISRRIVRVLIADDPSSLFVMAVFPVLTVVVLVPLAFASHRVIEVGFTRWLRQRIGVGATRPSAVTGRAGSMPLG